MKSERLNSLLALCCQRPRRWLHGAVRRIWLRTVRRQLWKCAHELVMLGQINGDIQPDIDAAKDALYRAVLKLDSKDSPNLGISR